MMTVQWKLRRYLDAHGLTAYRLAQAIPDMRQATIYRLASKTTPQSVNFEILGRILQGLRQLTGETVTPNDLLEVLDVEPTLTGPGDDAEQLSFDPHNLKTFNRRGPPAPLAQPTDMTALVAELRGKAT
jgi:hypothetical protein